MIIQYERYGASGVGVQGVPLEDTSKYGMVDGRKFADRLYHANNMIEKPRSEDAPKNCLAIMGRYILNPEIFDILSILPSGRGGEIQLTDGIQELGRFQEILAYEFEGRRYDLGDKQGFVEATIEFALRREDLSEGLMKYLRELVQSGN